MARTAPFRFALIVTVSLGGHCDETVAARLGFSRAYCLSDAIPPYDAISACTAVLQKFHRNPSAFIRRGVAFSELGEFDYAVGDFSRAIKLDPNSASAIQLRALAFEMRGQLQESLVDYMRALELSPSDRQVEAAILRVTDAIAAIPVVAQSRDTPDSPRIGKTEPVFKISALSPPPVNTARVSDGDELFLIVPASLILTSLAFAAWVLRRREDGLAALSRLQAG